MRILISYRRGDASAAARRLHGELAARYGHDDVAIDIDVLPPSPGVEDVIADEVGRSDVVLVVIGPDWLGAAGLGGRQLDAPEDPARRALEAALRTPDLLLVPCLVGGATAPAEADLPPSLRELAGRGFVQLTDGDWDEDLALLVNVIERREVLPARPRTAPPPGPEPAAGGATTPAPARDGATTPTPTTTTTPEPPAAEPAVPRRTVDLDIPEPAGPTTVPVRWGRLAAAGAVAALLVVGIFLFTRDNGEGSDAGFERLVASVPATLRASCAPLADPDSGATAVAECRDGDFTIAYYLFPDTATQDGWYAGYLQANGIESGTGDCLGGSLPGDSTYVLAGVSGRIFCTPGVAGGQPTIGWTRPDVLIGAVQTPIDPNPTENAFDVWRRSQPAA